MKLKIMSKLDKNREIQILLKKKLGLFKDHQALADFKEPVMFLMRRSGKVDFYEDIRESAFEFTHSGGEKRRLEVDPARILYFKYGRKMFKGYIHHEDYPTSIPENPIVTAEQYQRGIDKSLNDMKDWKTGKLREGTGKMIWSIAKAVGFILFGYLIVMGALKFLGVDVPWVWDIGKGATDIGVNNIGEALNTEVVG